MASLAAEHQTETETKCRLY